VPTAEEAPCVGICPTNADFNTNHCTTGPTSGNGGCVSQYCKCGQNFAPMGILQCSLSLWRHL